MGDFRIISFDGGGIRGVISIAIIKKLTDIYPDLLKNIDLFVGTSTGAIIALGLAMGLEPKEILNLYIEKGEFIFSKRYIEFFRPKYDNTHLYEVLSDIFHHRRLIDLKAYVIVPSFKLRGGEGDSWRPIFFNNFSNSETKYYHILDVAMASSAAPVYFPSYRNYVDGSIVAINPSISALVIALDEKGGNQRLKDISLLSIGTGFNQIAIKEDTKKWGLLEWQINSKVGLPLETAMLHGSILANDYYSSKLLQGKYLRINPKLYKHISLDDYKDIPYMLSLVKNMDFDKYYKWVEKHWLKKGKITNIKYFKKKIKALRDK